MDMAPPSLPGIITSIASVLTACSLVISALALMLPIWRRTKAIEQKTHALTAQVEEVHTIVNQAQTDARRYQAMLVAALIAANIAVPVDQSLIDVSPPEHKQVP